MKTIKDNQNNTFGFRQMLRHDRQREDDRRKAPCEGFTYISTVGWICRRERIRRQDSERLQQIRAFDSDPEI